MLAPILDFEKRSATEQAIESLPPEIQTAVKEKRAIEGMDRDQVIHGDRQASDEGSRDERRRGRGRLDLRPASRAKSRLSRLRTAKCLG